MIQAFAVLMRVDEKAEVRNQHLRAEKNKLEHKGSEGVAV